MNATNQSRIFISYSRRGNGLAWKEHLIRQLAVFEKHHLLDVWHDDETELGADWHARIDAAMKDARLAVLLLTDEFLKSPFVFQHELPELRRRHQDEGLLIAPILCEKCDWEANPWIASLQIKSRVQATPVPLASFSETDRERTLRHLATEIAMEISDAALAEVSAFRAPPSEIKTHLDKFPLTRGPGLREEKLIGREQELALLDLAFASSFGVPPSGGQGNRVNAGLRTAIVSLVAWGGVGKTMLVQHWLQRLQREGWFGARRVYAWSFYSQGTKEDRQASEDTFLAHALEWFGVQCEPTLSPWDKGRLLADAVARERTLLILDGIEPLQYPPGPMGGQLRAPGVQSLLKQLARKASSAKSEIVNSLCVATTRAPLTDLADFEHTPDASWGRALRLDLGNLTEEAGAALLYHAGAKRADAAEIKADDTELLAASREVDGHALTLNLLGRYLARAYGGDIRRRDLVKFEDADHKEQGGPAFKTIAAYEKWFESGGNHGARQLAVLRLLGLFDRAAGANALTALRATPAIPQLTEQVINLKEEDWNLACSFLADFGLLEVRFEGNAYEIECHPLVREHFARQLRQTFPEAWREGHRRLYSHFKTVSEPLFIQMTFHGSEAGIEMLKEFNSWVSQVNKNALEFDRAEKPTVKREEVETPARATRVFICYRREHGAELARLVASELRHRGITVFIDVDDLRPGRFDEELLRQIETAPNFIVVLTPGCLNRCVDSHDWMRKEIAHALVRRRNIIPIIKQPFVFPQPDKQEPPLPEDIRAIQFGHGITYSHEYYSPMIEKIVSFLRC